METQTENIEKQNSTVLQLLKWLPCFIYWGLIIYQIVLSIIEYNTASSTTLQWVGWILLWIAAIFGQLPIWTFRRYGKVGKGKSYVKTQEVVEKGIYSIMRHPQYFSWILITFGLSCLNQLWYSFVISIIITPIIYYDMIREERSNIEKFGKDYEEYMERIPRINFLWGINKLIKRSRNKKDKKVTEI